MNEVWSLNIDEVLEIYEIARKNGKKSGDSIEKELKEYMKGKNRKPIGMINQDMDQLTGNLREKGMKILNLKESERRKKNG